MCPGNITSLCYNSYNYLPLAPPFNWDAHLILKKKNNPVLCPRFWWASGFGNRYVCWKDRPSGIFHRERVAWSKWTKHNRKFTFKQRQTEMLTFPSLWLKWKYSCGQPGWRQLCLGHAPSKTKQFGSFMEKRWLDSITASMDMNLSKLQEMVGGQRSLAGYSPWAAKTRTRFSEWTTTKEKKAHHANNLIFPLLRPEAPNQAGRVHLPDRRLLSFILLLPCLGLSKFPLDSSGPHASWGSSVPGIWNAESTELTGEASPRSLMPFPPRSLPQGSRSSSTGVTWEKKFMGSKHSPSDNLEPQSLMLTRQVPPQHESHYTG